MLNNLHVKKTKTKHDHFYVGDEVPLSGEPQVGTQGLDTGHVNATEATFSKSPPSIRKNLLASFKVTPMISCFGAFLAFEYD